MRGCIGRSRAARSSSNLDSLLSGQGDVMKQQLRREDFPRFQSVRATPKAGKAPPPLACCQICPQKFYLALEMKEYTEPVKRKIYDSFLEWHISIHEKTSSSVFQGGETEFLEIETDMGKAGKGGVPTPPPSIENLGKGPCCSLCPDLFYPRLPPDPNAKRGAGIQLGFLESSESVFKSLYDRTQKSMLEKAWLKKGPAPPAAMLEVQSGYLPHIPNDAGMGSHPCCKVCPAQFFSPRSYGDVMAPRENSQSSSSSKGGSAKTGKAGSCCKTCAAKMMETSLMMVEGVDPDAPEEHMSAAEYATQKLAMQTSLPRNPSNKRVYGDAKAGKK
jgi:hypothetical protein